MNQGKASKKAFNVDALLSALAERRPIFHSEADFQHAFAWMMHEQFPDARIRLEMPIHVGQGNRHLDVLIQHRRDQIAIELKYKTQALTIIEAGETYELRSHSAHDCGRYDFIKDISRLERIVAADPTARGYAILLTNDPLYWREGHNSATADAAFRLHDGRCLEGEMAWSDRASAGTKKSREGRINLDHRYELNWKDYPKFGETEFPKFRYLAVTVCLN